MAYNAFLSYSHTADGKLASDLQSALHRMARPWYALRALHVFRDKTSLSANPALWPAIEKALSESNFFLLMASLGSVRSVWVAKEIAWWLDHRSPDTLIIIVTEGEVVWDESASDFDWNQTTSLPQNLRGKYNQEPLYVDLRWARTESRLSLRHSRFRSAVLDVASPLHRRPKDEIDGEDVRQNRRMKMLSWTAGFLLFVLTVASVIGAVKAINNARYAEEQRKEAEKQKVEALTQKGEAERQKTEAENERNIAQDRAQIALSRQLAAEATAALPSRQDLALLLGVEALHAKDTFEARNSLLTTVEYRPQLVAFLQGHIRKIQAERAGDDSNKIVKLALSRDGKRLATIAMDRTITLWDVALRRRIGQPIIPQKSWWHLAIDPDLTVLAINAEHEIVFWNIRSRSETARIKQDLGEVALLAFSPDGKTLATGSEDGVITAWDVNKHERIGHPLTTSNRQGNPEKGELVLVTPPSFLAFSPDGRMVEAAVGAGSPPKFWDLQTQQPAKVPFSERMSFGTGTLSASGKMMAIITGDGAVSLWEIPEGNLYATLDKPQGDCCGNLTVAFSPDDKVLAVGTRDGRIKFWDVAQHFPTFHPVQAHAGAVNDLTFTRDGKALISAGEDSTLVIWDPTLRQSPGRYIKLDRHARVGRPVFSPDGNALLAPVNGSVLIWNPTNLEPIGPPLNHQGDSIVSLAFSLDGKQLGSGCYAEKLLLWDWPSRSPLDPPMQASMRRGRAFSAVAFSPDGKLIASGSEDSSLILWDRRLHKELHRLVDSSESIRPIGTLAFSRDSKLLMAGGVAVETLWYVPSRGLAQQKMVGQTASSRSVAISWDGKTMAGSGPLGIVLWDIASRRRLGALLKPESPALYEKDRITSISFSPKGRLIAATNEDGAVVVWDVENRQQLGRTLQESSEGWQWNGSLAFSPDGKFLAVSDLDDRILLWEADPESWKSHACQMANRQLTQDEWAVYMGGQAYRPVCRSSSLRLKSGVLQNKVVPNQDNKR